MNNNDMPSKSEKKDETPKGEGEKTLGKGGSIVRPPKKSEEPKSAPKGMSAKGSKDEGKDAQTGHAGKNANKEEPGDAPSGVNDMEIPHMHLPEMLHQKEGDEVHLHVYGKVKAHNMEKGKNHSVIEIKKVHRDGETNNATPQPKNMAAMPLEQLKQSIKGSSPETYSKD